MNHCKKLGGRSSSVRAQKDWEQLLKDILSCPDTTRFPDTWLAATKVDNDPWPKGAGGAQKDVWRDYYTGDQLEKFTKYVISSSFEAGEIGDIYNCLQFVPRSTENGSWLAQECAGGQVNCLCIYEQ